MADAEQLFLAYRDRVFRYLCRAVGVEAAGDLTQEVFLRSTRAAVPAIADGCAWLFHVARNVALDHHRQRRRHPEVRVAAHSAIRPAQQDIALAVDEALRMLSDLDRDVFLMREVGGLNYVEIAAACSLTPDAVRSRIHRARLQLRTILAAPIAAWRVAGAAHSTEDV